MLESALVNYITNSFNAALQPGQTAYTKDGVDNVGIIVILSMYGIHLAVFTLWVRDSS